MLFYDKITFICGKNLRYNMPNCIFCREYASVDKDVNMHEECIPVAEQRTKKGKCVICGENNVQPFLFKECGSCIRNPNPKGFPY